MSGLLSQLPLDRLKKEAQDLGVALGERGMTQASTGIESLTGRLNDIAEGKGGMPRLAKGLAEGENPLAAGTKAVAGKVKDKVGGAIRGLSGGSGSKIKVTNIVESIDVPVSREVAYQQWTQLEDFPSFMKKVENVKQEDDNVVTWQAQIFWSHRQWKATIVDQVPNERIVWKSEAAKGRVDGAVTFHELAPDLTRILVTLEYHPKGLFEHTGNIWRAQGRRVRVELKHFRRHVATHTLLNQDDVDGWPGEIHDGEVTSENAAEEKSEGSEEKSAEESEGKARKGSEDASGDKGAESKQSSSDGPAKKSASQRSSKQQAAKKSTKKSGSSRPSRSSGSSRSGSSGSSGSRRSRAQSGS